jgi:hypothetical protein
MPAHFQQMVITSVLVLIMTVAVLAAEPPQVVARGDGGLVVTGADMGAMRASTPNFQPTKESLVRGTVRTVLFAREAEAVRCAKATDKQGFDRQLALSRCYLRHRLEQVVLLPGSIESYFRAHWRQFVDADGKVEVLNDDYRRQIRAWILQAKQKDFAKLEYERLCQKYHLVIIDEAGSAQ